MWGATFLFFMRTRLTVRKTRRLLGSNSKKAKKKQRKHFNKIKWKWERMTRCLHDQEVDSQLPLNDLTGVNCYCCLPCPAALMGRVMINCCISIPKASPKPRWHRPASQKPEVCSEHGSVEWKSPRLWLTVLQSTSTWKNKPARPSRGSVKYRC